MSKIAIGIQARRNFDAQTDGQRLLALVEQIGVYDRPFDDTAAEQG